MDNFASSKTRTWTDVDAVSAHARVRRQLTPCVARDAQRAVTFASVARIACDSDARVG